MQAGKLQHRDELQRLSESLGPNRQAVQTWTTYASGKAELRQSGLSEFLTTFGEGVSNNAVFLLRWVPGVAVSDRILHGARSGTLSPLPRSGEGRASNCGRWQHE